MTAVVFEFQRREKIGAKAVVEDTMVSAEVIIFPGVRHERLTFETPASDETNSPRSSRRKKSS